MAVTSWSAGASLRRKSAGTGAQRGVDVLVEVEGGEDENAGLAGEPPSHLEAVDPGHPDVHQHHVGT
jgi:hypothetical protein